MGKRNREEDLKDIKVLRTYLVTAVACGMAKAMPGMESRAVELDKKLDTMEAEFLDVLERS